MDKLKCRAWEVERKQWVNYGFCLRFDSEGTCQIVNAFGHPFADRTLIPSFWTGWRDCKGKDVYDGDILQDVFGKRARVVSYVDTFHCMSGFTLRSIPAPEAFEVFERWVGWAEIIGNIWEHPHLLEVLHG